MGAHSFFLFAETATSLCYQPQTADVALPLTISRPTLSGRLIRHRAGSTCATTTAYMRSILVPPPMHPS